MIKSQPLLQSLCIRTNLIFSCVGARERNAVERLLFVDVIAALPAERVILIDETSTHQDMLVPTLRAGDMVLMDNLRRHKTDAARLAIEAVGA